MKRTAGLLIVSSLFCIVAAAQHDRPNAGSKQAVPPPKTVDDAVLILKTKWLSPKDLDWLLRNPQKQAVHTLYRPFGMGVRNAFGLWGDNQGLLKSCGTDDPEACSVVIFNHLWESVRADANQQTVRQLDCQFRLAQSIRINYKGFYKLTTGQLLKEMQSQVNDQMAKLSATDGVGCQSSLRLETTGKPNLGCFVDGSFARRLKGQPKDRPTEASLEMVLGWLGFRNFFMPSHFPPTIRLNYSRSCQFPTPPYLYGPVSSLSFKTHGDQSTVIREQSALVPLWDALLTR